MNTTDLVYFCAAYELKNISRAAKASYITPQGMSRALQKLESELDVTLFDRTKKGIIPTVYADALYENSKFLINSLNNMKERIHNTDRSGIRELNVAMTLGVIDYLSVDFIMDFQARHPEIRLNIIMNTDCRVAELLRRDQADVGIIMGPVDVLAFDGVLFTSHRHCIILSKDHPLAKKKTISYQDLDGEPMAIAGREFSAYQNNMNRFLSAGVRPEIVFEVSEIESVHAFAQQNRGIGFTVDFAAFSHPRENTVILPLEDKNCLLQSFLITKKGKFLSGEARIFHEYALEWVEIHKDAFFVWNDAGNNRP